MPPITANDLSPRSREQLRTLAEYSAFASMRIDGIHRAIRSISDKVSPLRTQRDRIEFDRKRCTDAGPDKYPATLERLEGELQEIDKQLSPLDAQRRELQSELDGIARWRKPIVSQLDAILARIGVRGVKELFPDIMDGWQEVHAVEMIRNPGGAA
ncbi:MAG: hypothetical protein QM601_07235 [Pseudoxanthomonas sp.]